MELSIIIVNWMTKDYLCRCLQSVRENAPSADYEVIVVDNASDDGSAEMVSSEFPEVKLIKNSENRGYAEGNNQGMEASTGDYLLLLNPDTEIIKPGTIDAMLRFGRARANAAAVGCRLIGPDGKVQNSCRSFPEPLPILFEYTKLSKLAPASRTLGAYRMTYFNYDKDAEVDQPMASCLLLCRKAVDDVGMFDTDFPIFFNDVDWCYRARQNGWKIYFTASAEVRHHGGAGTSLVRPEMIVESHKSLIRFYNKHYKKRFSGRIFNLFKWVVMLSSFILSRKASRAG
jgi:GT2 family glycosyltransferase